MAGLLRRLRAALGMGLAWGVAWFLGGMALLLVVGPDAADVPFPLGFGMFGFFAGTLFSGVVSLVERNRAFDDMSIPRFAGWGALGGLLLSVAFVAVVALTGEVLPLEVLAPVFATAGAVSAAGSLGLARWSRPPEALGPDRLDSLQGERQETEGSAKGRRDLSAGGGRG